jgi:hypothetical protein
MTTRIPIFLAAFVLLLINASGASAQIAAAEYGNVKNETVLSGHIGSSFGGQLDDESLNFGGSLSWLWNSTVGAEVLAGFAPDFSVGDQGLDDTQINNYMVNLIAAVPLGSNAQWQPFVSGGLGALTLSTGNDIQDVLGIGDVDESELGGNIGFGLMGFAGNWGVRGDVRYYSEMGDPGADTLFLDDVDFWRTNIGLGYRW